jgi:hypothetical protein
LQSRIATDCSILAATFWPILGQSACEAFGSNIVRSNYPAILAKLHEYAPSGSNHLLQITKTGLTKKGMPEFMVDKLLQEIQKRFSPGELPSVRTLGALLTPHGLPLLLKQVESLDGMQSDYSNVLSDLPHLAAHIAKTFTSVYSAIVCRSLIEVINLNESLDYIIIMNLFAMPIANLIQQRIMYYPISYLLNAIPGAHEFSGKMSLRHLNNPDHFSAMQKHKKVLQKISWCMYGAKGVLFLNLAYYACFNWISTQSFDSESAIIRQKINAQIALATLLAVGWQCVPTGYRLIKHTYKLLSDWLSLKQNMVYQAEHLREIVSLLNKEWEKHMGDSLNDSFFSLKLDESYTSPDRCTLSGKLVIELLLKSFITNGLQPLSYSRRQRILTVAADMNLRHKDEIKKTFELFIDAELQAIIKANTRPSSEPVANCSKTSVIVGSGDDDQPVPLPSQSEAPSTKTPKRYRQPIGESLPASQPVIARATPWQKTKWPGPPRDTSQVFPIQISSRATGQSHYGFFACSPEEFTTNQQCVQFKETCKRGKVVGAEGSTGIKATRQWVKRGNGKWEQAVFKIKRLGKLDGDVRVYGFEIAKRMIICGSEQREEKLVCFDAVTLTH